MISPAAFPSPAHLECLSLGKVYRGRNGPVMALEGLDLRAGASEFVCIVGPSGCGKTTLLKLIAGLIEPTSGRVVFGSTPVNDRPRISMVFQEHGLFPWMTVVDNVAFGLEMLGLGKKERRESAREFIGRVGLTRFAGCYPHELSVGMQQRVGIARAFLTDPQMLLMDEPFGSLDAQTRLVLEEELLQTWEGNRKLVIHVTHDIEEAARLGDRVLVMTGTPGRIREEIRIHLGRPRQISGEDGIAIAEIKWKIWKILEEEVRRSLSLPA